MKNQRARRRGESGFAMLLVFVMAAAIAITLFIEVPRIAFESQRTREQMTIDRALQYKRGIQLFYRKYRTYPQTLDDLETTKNIRFLRRRYKDPLTGKEYRLLHVGPSGQLTDSLIQPAAPLPGSSTGSGPNSSPGPGQPGTLLQSSNSGQVLNSAQNSNSTQPVDPNNPNAQPPDPLNMALRRPSDRITPTGGGTTAGGQPGDPDSNPPAADQFQQQTQDPAQTGQQPVQPGQPGFQAPPGFPGQPGLQSGLPGQSGLPLGFPGVPAQQSTDPNQPGQPQFPGQQAVQAGAGGIPAAPPAGNAAANMIQQLLTTPRQPPSTSGFTTGSTGGIAGVASTAEGKGIHVVNDHTKYKEWEFVYDLKKDPTVVGASGVAQQQQVQQQIQQAQQPGAGFGNTGPASTSPFSSGPASSPGAAPAAPSTPPPSQ